CRRAAGHQLISIGAGVEASGSRVAEIHDSLIGGAGSGAYGQAYQRVGAGRALEGGVGVGGQARRVGEAEAARRAGRRGADEKALHSRYLGGAAIAANAVGQVGGVGARVGAGGAEHVHGRVKAGAGHGVPVERGGVGVAQQLPAGIGLWPAAQVGAADGTVVQSAHEINGLGAGNIHRVPEAGRQHIGECRRRFPAKVKGVGQGRGRAQPRSVIAKYRRERRDGGRISGCVVGWVHDGREAARG
nr:hypothetical protein [Tanacetum cinerariifolium]